MFEEYERAYVQSQRLARLATVSTTGQPDADAVGFEFDGERFFIGGRDLPRSRKYKNIAGGHQLVSLIIDDLGSTEPWRPRGIKLHGTAEIVTRAGRFGEREYFAITPRVSWSWGLVGDDYYAMHKVVWANA
jgi:pyridoxamine 5'-phosphate oxidase family protein